MLQIVRHLKTRIANHRSRVAVKEHFLYCDSEISFEYTDILVSTNQGENHLLTLEALQIEYLKSSIITKDKFRSRASRIRVKLFDRSKCQLY